MSTTPPRLASSLSTPGGDARRLTRGITATWWYTMCGVMFFELMIVLFWVLMLFGSGLSLGRVAVVALGGLLWCATTVLLLLQYRHREDTSTFRQWQTVMPLAYALGFGVLAGILSGLWVIGALPLAQSLILLRWPRGVRLRIALAVTLVLAVLWFIDLRSALSVADATHDSQSWWMLGIYSCVLPSMTVFSLWWWDVLVTLDQARAAESRLGATQERLRVATDVHDLQGHHLQVVALQLELAERLLAKDPDAAAEQLRAARASVDEARQGTRDLALRFRSVPLSDEIANAVDLLRAAGISAEASIDADADKAPASVLGPVIRETTTNILRHGVGKWARLSLTKAAGSWRYEVANDAQPDAEEGPDGSGLEGIARRAGEAGGTVDVRRGKQEFAIVVTVPESATEVVR